MERLAQIQNPVNLLGSPLAVLLQIV